MWFKSVLLICCIYAHVLAQDDVGAKASAGVRYTDDAVTTYRSRPIPVEEFITSHKIPESAGRPFDNADDDDAFDDAFDDGVEEDRRAVSKDAKIAKKVIPKFDTFEKKTSVPNIGGSSITVGEDESGKVGLKRQARVELENFGDTGILQEDGIRKSDAHRVHASSQKDSVIPGVYVSAEYPTTMMPVLTTSREARSFDFVPVNIIREDGKDSFASFADRHFGDLGDVSLVPAGSNSRIQVKKGPNGKDYEYEYVYYYYDEEDEGKAGTAGTAVTNSYEVPSRSTSPSSRRAGSSIGSSAGSSSGGTGSRAKFGSVERSSTAEPASNEVIPNRNGNRGRQLVESGEDVSEERLPTNTRFPPRYQSLSISRPVGNERAKRVASLQSNVSSQMRRSRSNHNTGTTEPTRARGNRPRPGLDLVDSSSFRTHQEGPEFPQILPKGPVRFLGVTPNEDNEEKPAARVRGRPQRVQESPVSQVTADEEPAEPQTHTHRRRPAATTTVAPQAEAELSRGQPTRTAAADKNDEQSEDSDEKDDADDERDASPLSDKSLSSEDRTDPDESEYSSTSFSNASTFATENPTTDYPSAMDKVALDLYAFLQQGQNNLVDTVASSEANAEDTVAPTDETTTITDPITTTDLSMTVTTDPTTTTTATTAEPTTTTTTTSTTTTTTTTTTTEPPTTTTQAPLGRGKFRRPGIASGPGSRIRPKVKSNNGGAASTEATPPEPTQRTRGRFGANAASNGGGFKRPRPGHRQPVEEDTVHKETTIGSANAEKPSATRGRFRGNNGVRTSAPTTSTTAAPSGHAGSSANGSASRPTFNKLNINRRRGGGRPTTAAPTTSEESQESDTAQTAAHTVAQTGHETVTAAPKSNPRSRLPGTGIRPIIRPGARVNLRQKPGQATITTSTTTTATPAAGQPSADAVLEEPAGEGTEEETHEAPAEISPPPSRSTTVNALTKLRNRNRLQVQPKSTTTRTPVPLASRRSPLLPRRKVPETPAAATQTSQEESAVSEEEATSDESEVTEASSAETSTAASTKHEETRGLSSLLAPRRRIAPRRPGQIVARD